MTTDQPGTEGRMFDLNRPKGFAKDEYLYRWGVAYDTIFDLIRRNNGNQNTRDMVMAVQFSISLIAHDHLRRKEEIVFYTAMDYVNKSRLSSQEKADEITRVCSITMGHLTSYVDQFRGLAHTLKVGELYNFEKPYAKVKNAFSNSETDAADIIQV